MFSKGNMTVSEAVARINQYMPYPMLLRLEYGDESEVLHFTLFGGKEEVQDIEFTTEKFAALVAKGSLSAAKMLGFAFGKN